MQAHGHELPYHRDLRVYQVRVGYLAALTFVMSHALVLLFLSWLSMAKSIVRVSHYPLTTF